MGKVSFKTRSPHLKSTYLVYIDLVQLGFDEETQQIPFGIEVLVFSNCVSNISKYLPYV